MSELWVFGDMEKSEMTHVKFDPSKLKSEVFSIDAKAYAGFKSETQTLEEKAALNGVNLYAQAMFYSENEVLTEEALGKLRQAFVDKNKSRFEMWLRTNDPRRNTLPFHQDNNTGECTWLNRKARRG